MHVSYGYLLKYRESVFKIPRQRIYRDSVFAVPLIIPLLQLNLSSHTFGIYSLRCVAVRFAVYGHPQAPLLHPRPPLIYLFLTLVGHFRFSLTALRFDIYSYKLYTGFDRLRRFTYTRSIVLKVPGREVSEYVRWSVLLHYSG